MYLLLHGLVCQKTAIEKKWDDNLQQDLLEGGNLVSVGSRRVFGMPGFFTDCRQLETIIAMVHVLMACIFSCSLFEFTFCLERGIRF